jgi:hypothetical protein
MVDLALTERLAGRDCPHIAALIQSADDLPAVLVSFHTLGASRNGWLVQGCLPGMAAEDRRKLIAAGLDAAGLEAAGRLGIIELDLSLEPDVWVDGWSHLLDERLHGGFDAVWFARRDRRMVTLCPYIVGARGSRPLLAHERAVVHDEVVDLRPAPAAEQSP